MGALDIIVLIITTLGFGLFLKNKKDQYEANEKLTETKVKDAALSEHQQAIKQAADDLDKGIDNLKNEYAKQREEQKNNVLSMEDRKNAWKDRQ